jgi:RNA polymerase sigma factor for flagellar operon FliA
MATPAESDPDVAALWQGFTASRDPRLRNRLFTFYRPYAKKLAVRLYVLRRDNSVSFDDYLQYAHVGLVESIDRFEPKRPVMFETFASYRIRGAILNGLAKETELSAQRQYWAARVRDRVRSLQSETWDRENVDKTLDGFVGLTVGLALGVLLESPAEPADESPAANPYAAAELGELVNRIRQLVAALPERERELLELHYFQHEPFQDIAARFKVTKGRVSQLHSQALNRLRQHLEKDRGLNREI